MAEESLEKGLVLAGLDALRQIGGDALVQVILTQAGKLEFAEAGLPDRVPIDDYLRYRDTAIGLLQESFCSTAFETGRILVRALRKRNEAQMQALLAQFGRAANKLPLIGQAAVLAAKGNPGSVRAAMSGPDTLVITIENCPECRGLERETPFCFLNQGVITEFAESSLGLRVHTEEKRCIAVGDPACEIEVTLPGDRKED